MRNYSISPSLCRLLGGIGFIGASMGFFYGLNGALGLGLETASWATFGLKGWLLFAGAAVVGIVFMLAGYFIGAGIRVESERADFFISSVWHFLAFGVIAWILLWGIWLRVKLGADMEKTMSEWLKQEGPLHVTLKFLGPGLAASVASGVIGGVVYRSAAGVFLGTLACYLLAGYFQTAIYGMPSWGWIFIGIVAAAATMFLAAVFIQRDAKERMRINLMRF